MPDSVLMPAPVSAVMRSDAETEAATRASPSVISRELCGAEPGLLRRRWKGPQAVEAHEPGESHQLGRSEPDSRQALAK